MRVEHLYPYLVAEDAVREGRSAAVEVGHGIRAILFEGCDAGPANGRAEVSAEQLRAEGLTDEEAHRIALENLARFAEEDPRLSIQLLGKPGDPVNLLLYSDHPLASACLRLPDLYYEARERLQADEICCCVPQGESLLVLPKRDRAYRRDLVAKLRAVEADALNLLSFDLFELSPEGVRPLIE